MDNSDFATAVDALAVTLGNLQADRRHLLSEDRWEELLEMVGVSLYQAGSQGRFLEAQALLSHVTINFSVEDTPISLLMRIGEVKASVGH